MAVISAEVFELKDQAGNPRSFGWFLYEFRGTYVPGGIAVDLSSYMRRVAGMVANPASGTLNVLPFPNETDFPADARSGRAQLFFVGSGAVTVNTSGMVVNLNTSGLGLSIASGTEPFLSGQLISGNISGQVQMLLTSGRLAAQTSGQLTGQATAWLPNSYLAEVVSGIATSGTRARIFAMGY